MAIGQTLIFDIIGRETASSAFGRAGAAADAASAKIMAAGKKMTAVGATMTRHVTLPVVALGVVSGKMATDFNAAMTRIQTQAGASAKDVKVLTDQVLELAGKAQQSPLELANSLYHLKSVGLDNVKAMRALKESSDLAAVGNADLEETTNALAGAWRTGIRGAGNFNHAVATLNAVIGAGNMTMEDLNAAIGTGFLPSAKTFGLSLKDVGSALAVMTDEGVPADAAATRLRMSFSLLGAPTAAAAKVLDGVGISADQLGHALRDKGLVGAIGLLKDHLQGLSKVDQAQVLSRAFGGGRSSAAIMTLVNNFDVLQQKEEQVRKGMGRFGEDVAKQAKTPQAQFKLLISTLEVASVKIGNELLPAVIKATHGLGDFVDWFSKLPKPVKQTTGEFVLFLAVLGPLLSIGGRLVTMYGLYIRALESMGIVQKQTTASTQAQTTAQKESTAATEAQSTATQGLSRTMAGVRFGAAVAGMAALTAGAETSNQKIKALTTIGGGALMGFAVGGPIGAAIGGAAGAIGLLAQHIGSAADAASGARSDFASLGDTLDNLTGSVTANTRKFVENELARTGTLKSLATYGISTRTAISAVLGEGKARDVVTAALKSQTSAIAEQKRQIARLTAANVADQKAGTLTPQENAKRKAQLDAYNKQIDAEQKVIDTVRNGIGATKEQIRAKRLDIQATQDLAGKLKGIPKKIASKIDLNGVYPTTKGIAEVAKKYHLLPKQIRTLIAATGVDTSVKAVERAKAKLQDLSKTRADLTAYQQSLRAGSHTAEAQAREIGLAVRHKVEEDPKQAKADLSQFQASLRNAAATARGIASTGGRSVGEALSAGVIAGFAGTDARLQAQASSAVIKAIAAARRAADAHSPSRKMAQLGRDLMDGLLQGIADREMTVQKAMERIQGLIQKTGDRISNLMNTRSGFLKTFSPDSIFGTDMSTGGDIGSLIAAQQGQASQAREILADVKAVTRMGLSKSLVRQLEAQGTSGAAALHALAMGSPAQIRQLNQLNKLTSDSLRAAGLRAGNYTRGGSIDADLARARKQEHKLEQIENHLKNIADTLKKGEHITLEISPEGMIREVKRRNKRKGVKTAGM